MKIVIIGPQGSGKGTQAEALSRHFQLPLFVTGAFFRSQVQEKTALGKKIGTLIGKGHLVSDELVFETLTQHVCPLKGWILDGTPRRLSQAEFIDHACGPVTAAIFIEISDQEAIRRISGRLYSSCGATFHEIYVPPNQPMICDRCGDRLTRRSDDSPEVVKHRLQLYHEWTKPVAAYYEQHGKLQRINGEQSIEKVFSNILASLTPLA